MRKIKNLALIGIGIVIGVGVSFAPDIHAATSKLLGGKVTKVITVKKDGKTIGEGGIIDGTTYLPVRTLVNSIDGIEVGNVTSSEVNLVSSEDGTPENNADPSAGTTPEIDLTEKAKQEQDALNKQAEAISKLNNEISALKIKIKNVQSIADEPTFESTANLKKRIELYESRVQQYPEIQGELNGYKDKLKKIEDDAAAAQKELEGLKSQLSSLESQLAELQK